jgi:hypothetical protein
MGLPGPPGPPGPPGTPVTQQSSVEVTQAPSRIPLYLLDYGDSRNIFQDGLEIAVKLIPGPHTRENNERSIVNPVKNGMKITWPSNTSAPATVRASFVGTSPGDGMINNVIYIILDKQVDRDSSVFYLTSVSGFQNMAPASLITQGYPIFSNISPATQQALEFKLGQKALARWQMNK